MKEYNDALGKGEDISEMRNSFANAFIEDLGKLNNKLNSADKLLLIFFDTYEVVEENPFGTLLRPDQPFPDRYELSNVGIVIAGRNKIDLNHMNWRGREKEIQTMPISSFTLEETKKYFEDQARVNISIESDDMQALFERTEGRPILLGLVNDVLTQRLSTSQELISIPRQLFEERLVAKINSLAGPIEQIILFMAHAYHRFNFSLLNWILNEPDLSEFQQEVNLEKTTADLLSLSFVRRPGSGEDFVLHDEMRPLVNRYCWNQDPDRNIRKTLSRSVIKYYEHELQHTSSEQLKQTYRVELLYHKLFVSLEDGYLYFTENFSSAVDLRLNSFARSLLREAKQFEKQMSPEQRYDLKFGEARLFAKEDVPDQALHLLDEVEQEASQPWLEKRRADILFEKGVAYQQLSRYSEAIEAFQASMDIEKKRDNMSDYAYLLNWLGSVYEKQGHLDTALEAYEEALDIHKRLLNKRACATALLNISNVYQLQGKVEEALRRAKTSWHIRNELFKQGEMSEVYVGWSLCTIGTVYYQIKDLSNANTFFQDALDVFNRTGHKSGLARIYNRMGKLSMDEGALPYARHWLERAYSASLNISPREQIYSLNKLGWIAVLEEQYQKAVDLLQQAIDLAKSIHDEYQQAESLTDLAVAFKHSGQDEESQRAEQEARQICQQYHYYYLLGLSDLSEGDVLYEAHKYKEAFVNYGEACYYMTQYNQLEYNNALRKVVDNLLETPPNQINQIVDDLVAYWSSQGLEKSHPDFISSCEEVRGLLVF